MHKITYITFYFDILWRQIGRTTLNCFCFAVRNTRYKFRTFWCSNSDTSNFCMARLIVSNYYYITTTESTSKSSDPQELQSFTITSLLGNYRYEEAWPIPEANYKRLITHPLCKSWKSLPRASKAKNMPRVVFEPGSSSDNLLEFHHML